MNREEKTHWTQDKILLYVKACMSATGLTRMPSRSELSKYYGNDKLTNAIRRFPGGYYKIAEILNIEMKESETQFGKYGEDLATKLLEEHGFAVERMSTRYAYDLYVNGSVKVDVKTARPSRANKSFAIRLILKNDSLLAMFISDCKKRREGKHLYSSCFHQPDADWSWNRNDCVQQISRSIRHYR